MLVSHPCTDCFKSLEKWIKLFVRNVKDILHAKIQHATNLAASARRTTYFLEERIKQVRLEEFLKERANKRKGWG
jgi:hypothetical protein